MDLLFQDIEEADKEFLARRERRAQRRLQERKRRQRKLLFIRILIFLLVIGTIIIICIHKSSKNSKADPKMKQQIAGLDLIMKEDAIKQFLEEKPKVIEPENSEGKQQDNKYQFESTLDTKNIDNEEIISSHGILVDASADTIVAMKGAYDRISPASMTKVLTVLVAAEAIEEENLDDTFTMTLEITDYAYTNDCSSVGFLNEETITIKDLFYGTILPSGGDAAVALATYVAGSHEAFVEMMNEKLENLGLSESAHFTNCVGLYDPNHYCSVYDMAVIMKAAMQNAWCREVLSAHTYTTVPTTEHPEGITISNWFLRRIEDKDTGGLVVGAKTGFVAQSGNCAVSYEEYVDGTPYICVTIGSSSSWRCIYDHVEIYNRYIPCS